MGIFVRKAGLEPAMSLDDGFTVRSRSRWSTSECFVEPRGVEPRSQDFQSCAYTKSAKAPCLVAPDGFEPPLADSESVVLAVTPWGIVAETKGFEPLRRFRLSVFRTGAISQLCQVSSFVTRERFELPTPTFVASCSVQLS